MAGYPIKISTNLLVRFAIRLMHNYITFYDGVCVAIDYAAEGCENRSCYYRQGCFALSWRHVVRLLCIEIENTRRRARACTHHAHAYKYTQACAKAPHRTSARAHTRTHAHTHTYTTHYNTYRYTGAREHIEHRCTCVHRQVFTYIRRRTYARAPT